MKAPGTNLILSLACAWILWNNGYEKLGWQVDNEYKTLSECLAASAKAHARLANNIAEENKFIQKKDFFERYFTSRIYNPTGRYRCLPTGVAPPGW